MIAVKFDLFYVGYFIYFKYLCKYLCLLGKFGFIY